MEELRRTLTALALANAPGSAGRLLQQTREIERAARALVEAGFIRSFPCPAVPEGDDCINVQLVSTTSQHQPVTGGLLYAAATGWVLMEISERGSLTCWRESLFTIDDCPSTQLDERIELARIQHGMGITETLGNKTGCLPEFVMFNSPLTPELLQALHHHQKPTRLVAVLPNQSTRAQRTGRKDLIVEYPELENSQEKKQNPALFESNQDVFHVNNLIGFSRLMQGSLGRHSRTIAQRWQFPNCLDLEVLEFYLQPVDLHFPVSVIQVSCSPDEVWDRKSINKLTSRIAQVLKRGATTQLFGLAAVDETVLQQGLEVFHQAIVWEQTRLDDQWLGGLDDL